MDIAEGTVRKTDLEDQWQGINQEIKKEITIETKDYTNPTNGTVTCTTTKSFKSDLQRKISLLGRKVAAIPQKVWHVLSYTLLLLVWLYIVIILLVGCLFTIVTIFGYLYVLVKYVFGLDNILTITCWVPFVGILVIVGIFLSWKIIIFCYESMGHMCAGGLTW